MKTVLFLFLLTFSVIALSEPIQVHYELRLERPPVKDPIACRLSLSIEKENGVSCYYQAIITGKYEDCDVYYNVNGSLKSCGQVACKNISAEDALQLLGIPEIPNECW
jgi:hypothetical protein